MISLTRKPLRCFSGPEQFSPTPDEIRERAAEIRKGWTAGQRRRRMVGGGASTIVLTMVCTGRRRRWAPLD